MKNILASLLAVFGLSTQAQVAATPKVQTIDPKSLLFTLSTISDDLPRTISIGLTEAKSRLSIGEDDWAQVQFFPKSMESEVKRMLKELKDFERKNRVGIGWKNVYVRKLNHASLIIGVDASTKVAATTGSMLQKPPVLIAVGQLVGEVKDGFTVPLGGNIALYGVVSPTGVSSLAASVGEKPDDVKLTQAFSKLNAAYGLILVDWRSMLLLLGTSARGQIDVWQP